MKKYLLTIRISIFCLILFSMSFIKVKAQDDNIQGIKFRSLTLEQAIQTAKAENKKVFVHGFADWCHFCMYMKDSVYIDKEVANFFNANFVCIKIDMEKEGAEMNKALLIHTFPAFLFYDANGEFMHRAAGRKYKQAFLELGNDALKPEKQMRTYKNKFDTGTATPYEVMKYFRMLEMSGMDAQPMINTYLLSQPDSTFSSSNNWRIFNDITKDAMLPAVQRVINYKREFEKKYTVDSVNNKFIGLYNKYLTDYVQRVDSVGYEAAKKRVKAIKGLDIADKICAWADLNKLKMKSDWERYKIEGKIFIENYGLQDARRLYEVSQVYYDRFYSDKAVLAQAEQWTLKAISIADTYKSNNLLASISVMLGKKEQALKYANHAVELAKATNTDYKQTSLLIEKIETMQ